MIVYIRFLGTPMLGDLRFVLLLLQINVICRSCKGSCSDLCCTALKCLVFYKYKYIVYCSPLPLILLNDEDTEISFSNHTHVILFQYFSQPGATSYSIIFYEKSSVFQSGIAKFNFKNMARISMQYAAQGRIKTYCCFVTRLLVIKPFSVSTQE